MRFGIPDKLKIGGLEYEVIFEEDRNRDHGKNASGTCATFYQKIWLEYGNRKQDGIQEDCIHEILEAMDNQFDLSLSHQTITTLATGLYQVLKDNGFAFRE